MNPMVLMWFFEIFRWFNMVLPLYGFFLVGILKNGCTRLLDWSLIVVAVHDRTFIHKSIDAFIT